MCICYSFQAYCLSSIWLGGKFMHALTLVHADDVDYNKYESSDKMMRNRTGCLNWILRYLILKWIIHSAHTLLLANCLVSLVDVSSADPAQKSSLANDTSESETPPSLDSKISSSTRIYTTYISSLVWIFFSEGLFLLFQLNSSIQAFQLSW